MTQTKNPGSGNLANGNLANGNLANGNLGIVVTASLAGLLFGFDTVVISGVTESVGKVFELSKGGFWYGFAVASALVGTLIGALVAGIPGDRYGSRDTLKVVGFMYVVSALGCALCWNIESFYVCRFIGGLAIGASSVLAPVYISEIAPAERRGALTGLFQFNIVLGILVAFASNAVVSGVAGDDAWRIKLGIAAVPAVVFALLIFNIPQSPRWLAMRGRKDDARDSLARVGVADVEARLAEFERAADDARRESTFKLFSAANRKPIVLAILLAMFNQLSGINAILYYLNDIFAAAGFVGWSNDLQAVAIGAANLIATVIALRVIDKVGRRKLLLIGAIGTAVALAGVALIFATGEGKPYLLPMLITFIAFFAFSQGAVIWVYLAEIFPTPVRSRGQALGSATHWGMNAIIAQAFPMIALHTQALPFVFFSICMVLQFFVVLAIFPETRGVELESMDKALEGKGAGT
ncbi:MAG TPA: sugar porter family MFS transporter [Steroidobacteraceae bacterium]|nr:sugar porter family MFS transporter [Steroidobacteraceae bacterium]